MKKRVKQQKLRPGRPRRVNQTGQRHVVLCRLSNLGVVLHDLQHLRQGKYEERKREKKQTQEGGRDGLFL